MNGTAMTRRQMLATTAAGAAAAVVGEAWGQQDQPRPDDAGLRPVHPHRIVLLADTHIHADPAATGGDPPVAMADRLRRVVAEITALQPTPAVVVVNGDLAHDSGETGDYELFAALLGPLIDRGIVVLTTLGNHDHRQRFRQVLGPSPLGPLPGGPRHVSRIALPRATLVLLDSLDQTDAVEGSLHQDQLEMFDAMLGQSETRTIVALHHPPLPDPDPARPLNLQDHAAFWAIVEKHPQVKAVFHGHHHAWKLGRRDNVHLVSQPPTAYLFDAAQPWGYLVADLTDEAIRLALRAMDGHDADGAAAMLPA